MADEEMLSIEVAQDNGAFVVRMPAEAFFQFIGQIATDKFIIQLGSKPRIRRGRPPKDQQPEPLFQEAK